MALCIWSADICNVVRKLAHQEKLYEKEKKKSQKWEGNELSLSTGSSAHSSPIKNQHNRLLPLAPTMIYAWERQYSI